MLPYAIYKRHKDGKAKKERAVQKAMAEVEEEEARSRHSSISRQGSQQGSPRTSQSETLQGSQSHDSAPVVDERYDQYLSPSAEPPRQKSVLDREDESFLASILSSDDETPPPLPPRVQPPVIDASIDSDASSIGGEKEETKETKEKKESRVAAFFHRKSKHEDSLRPEGDASSVEDRRESRDLGRVLDRLNLSAKNNKVLFGSDESSQLLRRFTQIFKDLANGVPTAYGDLTSLFENHDSVLSKGFEKLPSSLKKLVVQLPEKVTSSLGPEIMLAAAEAQGIETEGASLNKLLLPQNIWKLVSEPGAVVGMLRAIVAALRARWPAFLGMNVIWSVALFLLMMVLWYCYKRGREVRLEKEKGDGEPGTEAPDEEPPSLDVPETAPKVTAS